MYKKLMKRHPLSKISEELFDKVLAARFIYKKAAGEVFTQKADDGIMPWGIEVIRQSLSSDTSFDARDIMNGIPIELADGRLLTVPTSRFPNDVAKTLISTYLNEAKSELTLETLPRLGEIAKVKVSRDEYPSSYKETLVMLAKRRNATRQAKLAGSSPSGVH